MMAESHLGNSMHKLVRICDLFGMNQLDSFLEKSVVDMIVDGFFIFVTAHDSFGDVLG